MTTYRIIDSSSSTPIEFRPWATIPAERKRGTGAFRLVLGTTFLGEPAWLPYMGEPTDADEAWYALNDGWVE